VALRGGCVCNDGQRVFIGKAARVGCGVGREDVRWVGVGWDAPTRPAGATVGHPRATAPSDEPQAGARGETVRECLRARVRATADNGSAPAASRGPRRRPAPGRRVWWSGGGATQAPVPSRIGSARRQAPAAVYYKHGRQPDDGRASGVTATWRVHSTGARRHPRKHAAADTLTGTPGAVRGTPGTPERYTRDTRAGPQVLSAIHQGHLCGTPGTPERYTRDTRAVHQGHQGTPALGAK
jgi:hypothetical protein